jgi:hypothetical protein
MITTFTGNISSQEINCLTFLPRAIVYLFYHILPPFAARFFSSSKPVGPLGILLHNTFPVRVGLALFGHSGSGSTASLFTVSCVTIQIFLLTNVVFFQIAFINCESLGKIMIFYLIFVLRLTEISINQRLT